MQIHICIIQSVQVCVPASADLFSDLDPDTSASRKTVCSDSKMRLKVLWMFVYDMHTYVSVCMCIIKNVPGKWLIFSKKMQWRIMFP